MTLNSNWVFPASNLLNPPPANPLHRETLTTPAASQPLSATELRDFARLDDYDDDTNLTAAIAAAVGFVERELGVALLPQTWTATVEGSFPPRGFLPARRPFSSLTSITTVRHDADDDVWEAADYLVRPGNVIVPLNTALSALGENDWVSVVYVAGYADAANVPGPLMHALKIVAHEYAIWARDLSETPFPQGWPGMSWMLAKDFQVFRGA